MMSLGHTVRYSDFFTESRPDITELLREISSETTIRKMAVINSILSVKGRTMQTQYYLLGALTIHIRPELRNSILYRGRKKIEKGYELFAFHFTATLITAELSHFKTIEQSASEDVGLVELNILKAYIAVVDEANERDALMAQPYLKEVEEGGDPLKLTWPHLIRQVEFIARPDMVYETYRGLAFVSYLDRHPHYGEFAKRYFSSLGCASGQDYIRRVLSIAKPQNDLTPAGNPEDFLLTIKTRQHEPVLEALTVEPDDLRLHPFKQTDNRGLKERPLFRYGDNKYVILFEDFLYNNLFTGILFSFFKESGIGSLFNKANAPEAGYRMKGFPDFKNSIGQEFAEDVLFKNTMVTCFGQKHDVLKFFDPGERFNPDCYYRRKNHIFLFEFKDPLMSSDVIQSGSYEKIKESIDKVFATQGTKKAKGIYQLARHIASLAGDDKLLPMIDGKAKHTGLSLEKMVIHPVIVHTSVYIDLPGLNSYLDERLNAHLDSIRPSFKRIAPLTVINLKYFYDKLLLFRSRKLEFTDELAYYHKAVRKKKAKANKTSSPDDWFESLAPFGYLNSPAYLQSLAYRQKGMLGALIECWEIDKEG